MSKEKEIKTAGFKKKHVTQRSFVKLGNTRGSYIYICTRQTLLILSENLSLYKFSLYNQNLHLSQAVTFFLFIIITIEGSSAKERYATMIILKDIKILWKIIRL